MDKSRITALTDGVVAIIMTIMALEFKVPSTDTLASLLRELPYLLAFGISFFFVGVAWYNHHYMFALLKHVSRKIYWVNNVWLFSMALIPMATGWAGDYMNRRVPEYFYLLVFTVWTLAFGWLCRVIIQKLMATGQPEVADKVRQISAYQLISSYKYGLSTVVVAICTYFWPFSCMLFTLLYLIHEFKRPSRDSDQLF